MRIRIILFILCFWGFSQNTLAQLSGLKTIGTGGDYTTFALAVADLNAQGVGATGVTFEFIDNTGSSTFAETITATLSITTTTATAANQITFRPATSITTATLTVTGAFINVDLNGADYVNFDGQNGGTGGNKNLIFVNTNASNPVIQFRNGASNNQILYTKIQSANAGTASAAVFFAGSTGGANTLNTIDNCEISGIGTTPNILANGIFSSGSVTPNNNANNTISNCFIFDYFVGGGSMTNGIFLGTSSSAWTITGNRFYQTASRTYTGSATHRAIQINATTGNNFTITNNIIGFNSSAGDILTNTVMNGGVASLYYAIDLSVGTTTASNVKGNIIQNIRFSTTSGSITGIFAGIRVLAGNVNIGGTGVGEGNNIGDNTTNGNITVTTTTTGAAALIAGIRNAGGAVNIQGNKIGSITGVGSATVTYSIIAVESNSGGSITDNIIGSTIQSNSLYHNTTSSPNVAILMHGIFINNYTGANAVNINNNIIANLTNGYAGTNTGAVTRGIYSTGSMTGNLTINNNQIFNITTAATQNGSGYNNSALGGIGCNNAVLVTITGNQVYNLSQTGGTLATQIYGIFPNISNIVTNIVSKNLIYDLSSTSTGATAIYGLRMSGGGGAGNTCANNVIRLGQGITASHILYGLYDLTGTSNFYFNSVYITGTVATGSARSFAMANDASNVRRIRNNIFVNTRDNATSGVNKHYAYFATTGGTVGLTSDNNIMFANGTDGFPFGRGGSTGGTITNYATYKNYRVAFPTLEVNSAVGNPQLVDPANPTTPNLSLALLSPAFQTGTSIGLITDDYAGTTRSLTTPNIGAYETASSTADATTDIFTPTITYTNFTNYNVTTGTRTLTATITDKGIGLPLAGVNVPRLYFRNLSASGLWQNVGGINTSGTGNNGTWDFVLDQDALALVSGQTVAYYVVAQDNATVPNIWYNGLDATILHSNVNTRTAEPTTPNTYIVSGAMGGVYNIPNQFNSLTKAGGIFQAINNATSITSNITINVTADLDEDATNDLSAWLDGGIGHTLTIQPDASTLRTIQNSVNITTANLDMIRINTAVGVMIDGGTSKNLLFRNTNSTANNTGATIAFSNTASKLCTIQNVTVENNTNSGTEGNINILGGTNNVNINNCNIGDATAGGVATGVTRRGIYEASGSGNIVNIQNNNIYNFLVNGVVLNSCADGAVVSGNKFYYNFVGAFPAGTTIISIQNNGNHTVSNNVIGGNASDNTGTWDFSANALLTGIQIQGTNAPNTISGNNIKNISLSITGANSPKFTGVSTGSLSQATITNLTIDNITIPSATSAPSIEGVRLNGNGVSVSNSTFSNMSMGANNAGFFHVMNCLGLVTYNISNCTINNITSRTTGTGNPSTTLGFTGITTLSGASLNVIGCTLSNMASNGGSELRAIFQNTASAVGTYTRNRIFGLTSSSGQIMGISANNGDFNTSHNQITITNGAGTNNLTLTGIYENTSGIKAGNHYFNTVYIGGTQTGGSVTSHCYRRDNSNSNVNLRNNVFINERVSSNGTGNHFVISATTSTFTTTWVSNYNLYVKGTTANNFIASSGISSATTYSTYSAWKTAQTGEGNNSWNAITGATSDYQTLNPSNLFVDLANGNLNINTANQELWFVNGKGTQITGFADDFGATAVRSTLVSNGGTDLGSDEINANTGVNPILANATGSFTNNGIVNFIFAGRQVGTIMWGGAGAVPTGLNVWYYSGSRPLYPNPNAQFFNAYWRVEPVGAMGTTYNITLNYDNALIGGVGTLANTKLSKRESAVTPPNNFLNNWITEQTLSSINVSTNSLSNSGFIYNSFSEFTGSQDVASLPLQLLSFEAKRQNNTQNQLQWTTANEVDLKYFAIEKSQNGKDFISITQIDATNKSNQAKNYQYSYIENQSTYYRLRFIHNNSADEFSIIRFVAGNEDTKFFVYPNPLQGKINFEVSENLKQNKDIALQVVNNQGKIIANFVGDWNKISDEISQTHQNWESGLYFWNITPKGKKTQVIKVIKP